MKVPSLFPTIPNSLEFEQMRLTAAENAVESAKHEWKMAKRKRTEVKAAAARAKKQFKRAKAELAQARIALDEAEQRRVTEKPAARTRKSVSKRLGKRPSARETAKKRRQTRDVATSKPTMETSAAEQRVKDASEPPDGKIATPATGSSVESSSSDHPVPA
jgi:hypothetical protein